MNFGEDMTKKEYEEMYDVLATSTLMDLLDSWEFDDTVEVNVIKDIITKRLSEYGA